MFRVLRREMCIRDRIVSVKNEETGISCSSFCNNCSQGTGNCKYVKEMVEKLAEYEDLEEQGKLLKVPCKVGNEVFIPIDFQNKIHQGIVIGIEYSKIRKGFVARIRTVDDDVCYEKFEDFGKTVFLTHEEAENFLAKIIEKDSENR